MDDAFQNAVLIQHQCSSAWLKVPLICLQILAAIVHVTDDLPCYNLLVGILLSFNQDSLLSQYQYHDKCINQPAPCLILSLIRQYKNTVSPISFKSQ